MTAVGVDACKGGWVAFAIRSGGPPEAHFVSHIATLSMSVPDARVVAIDIPIGLPERGVRQADEAARLMLGPRRHSVFMTPVRSVLEASSHAVATALATEATGMGISQQAFALRSKIFEVEEWLQRAECPVYEVHPEVSFAVMTGRPALAPKKSWHGMAERCAALAAVGISMADLDPIVGARVGTDDMVDAAMAAWTASRLLAGEARSFPDPPERNSSGRPSAIWA